MKNPCKMFINWLLKDPAPSKAYLEQMHRLKKLRKDLECEDDEYDEGSGTPVEMGEHTVQRFHTTDSEGEG